MIFNIQSMGMKIWPCHGKVESHPRIIIWTTLADLESLMFYTKIQPWSFLCSGEDFFKCFLPYTCMAAILFNDAESFKHRNNTPSPEGPMWNLVKIGQAFQRRRHLKIMRFLYKYTAQER